MFFALLYKHAFLYFCLKLSTNIPPFSFTQSHRELNQLKSIDVFRSVFHFNHNPESISTIKFANNQQNAIISKDQICSNDTQKDRTFEEHIKKLFLLEKFDFDDLLVSFNLEPSVCVQQPNQHCKNNPIQLANQILDWWHQRLHDKSCNHRFKLSFSNKCE